ncbi:MAG TPA: DUF1028 domain-containing protein [Pseudomonadales bacterium]|nr:DUF1028 domain-containing protein [Pseudomonadales bacterium]
MALALFAATAQATFTIVAVDPTSGAVGFAGATCGIGIEFVPAVVPDRGVVAAQAETSFIGRDAARDWIAHGDSASAVLGRLADPNLYRQAFYQRWFASQLPDLQYGVATLTGTDAGAYSGSAIPPWSGAVQGPGYSVQGNTLRNAAVVADAARAFDVAQRDGCALSLAERLLAALEAARGAGGDSRCPAEAPDISAALIVAERGDPPDAPRLVIVAPRHFSFAEGVWLSIVGYTPKPTDPEPVAAVRAQFDARHVGACAKTG